MDLTSLMYDYPESLIATHKQAESRIMYVAKDSTPIEFSKVDLFNRFSKGDLLVINDTKVEKRRVKSQEGFDVLFVEQMDALTWQVLFPASRIKNKQTVHLPNSVTFTLQERGLPQTVTLNKPLPDNYFMEFGEMALPPYIQKKRQVGQRFNDETNYQTAWADKMGSCAAPTASLHFTSDDLLSLEKRGVQIQKVTLHVGLGTFLPIKVQNLQDHKMHSEKVLISNESIDAIKKVKAKGAKLWSLGTTTTRVLESINKGYFKKTNSGFEGETDLFLYPGKKIEVVDNLLTNFHQPGSTLMALVASFSDLNQVKQAYKWAIDKQFKLFSYGDLSVWEKSS